MLLLKMNLLKTNLLRNRNLRQLKNRKNRIRRSNRLLKANLKTMEMLINPLSNLNKTKIMMIKIMKTNKNKY